jgi:hypothetical protein
MSLRFVFGGAGFSLWILVAARSTLLVPTPQAEACATKMLPLFSFLR